jgi:hypothetical protein
MHNNTRGMLLKLHEYYMNFYNVTLPALELVTLGDEEEQQPVSSRTRSRKK